LSKYHRRLKSLKYPCSLWTRGLPAYHLAYRSPLAKVPLQVVLELAAAREGTLIVAQRRFFQPQSPGSPPVGGKLEVNEFGLKINVQLQPPGRSLALPREQRSRPISLSFCLTPTPRLPTFFRGVSRSSRSFFPSLDWVSHAWTGRCGFSSPSTVYLLRSQLSPTLSWKPQ